PPFAGTYGIVVRGYDVPLQPRIELFCPSRVKLRYPVAQSSIPEPGNAECVLTVGAIAWSSWSTGSQEPFSSRGPTNRSRLNTVSLVKPDLMGPDQVDTLSYGTNGFAGTSASGPHVAGAAAIVWSAHPTWTASEVRLWLEQQAVDMGGVGKDNLYGYGRLNLPVTAQPTPPSALSHTYGQARGWYMVSVPTTGDSAAAFAVPLYRWNGTSYEPVVETDPTAGYWAKLPASKTVIVTGSLPLVDQTLVLGVAGWHMVSAPWPYPKAAIQVTRSGETRSWADAVAAGWVRNSIYGFKATDRAYTTPTTLDPWYGYWVDANVSGLTLRFVYASRATTLGLGSEEAELVPLWEAPADLPPLPPAGSVVEGGLRFANVPNPIRDVHTTTFQVLGPLAGLVTEIKVVIFDLSGKLVWQGSAAGAELDWHTDDLAGWYLANGVYFYQITARVAGTSVSSGIMKLAIYR
ncbi:MAG: S8 family peptidase, partial [Candidatus Bipolaricaulis anaerobius]|nr:S8 family peptidase [Candidatus Bipolaricaulis anaerobius]